MRFLLIHSPLVQKETWSALVLSLQAAGFEATVVSLDNRTAPGEKFFEHHVSQIHSASSDLNGRRVVAVAHSGAGNLLALLDPSQIEAYVFLDAIFPLNETSRFDVFDDPAAVRSWKEVANEHGGVIPRALLVRFGEQISDDGARGAFVAGIVDVPIELYEEPIPVHSKWPPSKPGLFVQWTESYAADAIRAEKAGFEVRRDSASHFKMLNQPDEVARELADFARAIE